MVSGKKLKNFLEDRKIKLVTGLGKQNNKFAVVLSVAVLTPLLLLGLFFYGGLNFSKITSSLGVVFQSETQVVEDANGSFSDLRLISREDFLKKYNPKPAFLPQAIEIYSSLSDYIRNNSTPTLLPARNWSVPFIDIKAESALAVDMPSNKILYGKNVFEIKPIASITKLMTALVAVENMNLSDIATVNTLLTERNSARLEIGEELTIEQLLYAVLLESSNEAAMTIKEFYNGNRAEDMPDFVSLMNQKTAQLALKDTIFVEPTGLSAENQTSALGVASILWAAFQNETLAQVMATPNYTTNPLNRDFTHYWVNLNTLISAYEDIIAGKTGYTEEAGPSMVSLSVSPNPDRYIIVVVLNAEDRIGESTNLFNWVKQAYIWKE